jgi:PIN domain nuclease of toxin-antitoxin system
MKLLLDTHTTIWWLDAPQKLGKAGFRMIADPENEVLISAIVPWEIAIKMNSGKMPPHVLTTDFLRILHEEEFTFLQIHPLHAIRSGLLPFHHRDPFDRLLAAQSLELGVLLISIDAIFDRYGVERIW